MIPHRCPVCNGKGTVPSGFYNDHGQENFSTAVSSEQCRSCHGTGIVWGNEVVNVSRPFEIEIETTRIDNGAVWYAYSDYSEIHFGELK